VLSLVRQDYMQETAKIFDDDLSKIQRNGDVTFQSSMDGANETTTERRKNNKRLFGQQD
jgi:hypothetical protein